MPDVVERHLRHVRAVGVHVNVVRGWIIVVNIIPLHGLGSNGGGAGGAGAGEAAELIAAVVHQAHGHLHGLGLGAVVKFHRGGIANAVAVHGHIHAALAHAVVAGHLAVVGVHPVVSRAHGSPGLCHQRAAHGVVIAHGHLGFDHLGLGRGGSIRLGGEIQPRLVAHLTAAVVSINVQIGHAQLGPRVGIGQLGEGQSVHVPPVGQGHPAVPAVGIADQQLRVHLQGVLGHIEPIAALIAAHGHLAGIGLGHTLPLAPLQGEHQRRHIGRGQARQRGQRQQRLKQQRSKAAGRVLLQILFHHDASWTKSLEVTTFLFRLYYEIMFSSTHGRC